MATEWTGWTTAEIIVVAKATWGEGWSGVAGSLAGVNAAICSAWCEALATCGQDDTGLDPAVPAKHPTAFNQYFGHWALYKVGMVLAAGSAATERFKQAADFYRDPKRLTAAGIHKYSTA